MDLAVAGGSSFLFSFSAAVDAVAVAAAAMAAAVVAVTMVAAAADADKFGYPIRRLNAKKAAELLCSAVFLCFIFFIYPLQGVFQGALR